MDDLWRFFFAISAVVRGEKTNSFSARNEPSMSNLAERFGLLHTVDWPEPSRGSKTHRELHSMLVAFANSGNHRTCSTVRKSAGLFLFDHH